MTTDTRDVDGGVRNETEEQLRALVEVWTSPETTQALQAQLAGISSQPLRRRDGFGPPW